MISVKFSKYLYIYDNLIIANNMIHTEEAGGSYQLDSFTDNRESEVKRLKAQVELFFDKEFALYKKIGLKDGMNIIECGCGPGFLIRSILKELPDCKATGLEIDPYFLEVLEETSVDNNNKLFQVKEGSIYDTKLPDNAFDFAVSRLVIEHLEDPMKAFAELNRILKPGGKLVIVSNDFAHHLLTYPVIPELSEMYNAYCQSRFAQGGNPLVGRQLPGYFKNGNFIDINVDIICAHSHIAGERAFLNAENVNISKRLVKEGFLKKETLDALADKWYKMLKDPDHVIYRQLFVVTGVKSTVQSANTIVTQDDQVAQNKRLTADDLRSFDVNNQKIKLNEYLKNQVILYMEDEQLDFNDNEKLCFINIDSLAATELSSLIKTDFMTSISISDILDKHSIQDISQLIVDNMKDISAYTKSNTKDNDWTEGEL